MKGLKGAAHQVSRMAPSWLGQSSTATSQAYASGLTWLARSSGLSPQEYAALNRMPMGSSEPEVREWPKFLRVRVSGDLNYTKVLTGNAAERGMGTGILLLALSAGHLSSWRHRASWAASRAWSFPVSSCQSVTSACSALQCLDASQAARTGICYRNVPNLSPQA